MRKREENNMSENEVKHVKWDEVPVENVNPLIERQFVVGDQVMVAKLLLRKGCVVPMHSHVNEQITNILSGALQFTIDGKEITVGPGEYLCIPPNLPHMAVALEDTIDIDIFTPPREDWINKTDLYLRSK
jgi:quercetin dioxygenase-like cupin family protein